MELQYEKYGLDEVGSSFQNLKIIVVSLYDLHKQSSPSIGIGISE
jgi:hypothetical protein